MDTFNRIPAFYFPTNVMIIDDDKALLNSLSLNIDKSFPYILQDDPAKGLKYLESHTFKIRELAEQLSVRHEDTHSDDFGENPVKIYSADLLKKLASPERFDYILCAVIDKVMNNTDGIEVCRRIKDNGLILKRILLTGNAGTEEAVKAFNSREIDAYVPKIAKDEDTRLVNEHLRNLVWTQFLEIGDSLLGSLSSKTSLLANDSFVKIFHETRKAHQIVEFYLYDSAGSFIMYDADGKAKLMLVKHDDDFDMMADIMEDTQAPETVIKSVSDRKAYPYSRKKSDLLHAEKEGWAKFMIPVSNIPGTRTFYAIVEPPNIDFFSFNQYMESVWSAPQ